MVGHSCCCHRPCLTEVKVTDSLFWLYQIRDSSFFSSLERGR
jgi:hypothetical protein